MAEQDLTKDLLNAARDCISNFRPYFSRFLSESELAQVQGIGFPKDITAVFCGGAENCEPLRCCLGLFPAFYFDTDKVCGYDAEVAEMFPIKAVTLTYRREDTITHRDVLGSLMALGIGNQKIALPRPYVLDLPQFAV
jgi:RNA-binding protein YlmH